MIERFQVKTRETWHVVFRFPYFYRRKVHENGAPQQPTLAGLLAGLAGCTTGPSMGPKGSKKGPRRARRAQMGPKRVQNGSKRALAGSKKCPKTLSFIDAVALKVQKGPKRAQKGPKRDQKGSKKGTYLTFPGPFYSENSYRGDVFVTFAAKL